MCHVRCSVLNAQHPLISSEHSSSSLRAHHSVPSAQYSIINAQCLVGTTRASLLHTSVLKHTVLSVHRALGTQYSALNTQLSVLSTQYSVLTIRCSILYAQHSVVSTQFSILNTYCSLPDAQCSVLSPHYSALRTQAHHSELSTQDPIHST